MNNQYDLSGLSWRLAGFAPHSWRFDKTMELGLSMKEDVPPVAAAVPGSVQGALRSAGILPDWNLGMNHRLCEWVENRQWIYETELPSAWLLPGARHVLNCAGLDYSGWVVLNGREIGAFAGTHIPHRFDLTPALTGMDVPDAGGKNTLRIIFDCPPRWLGQFGFTSKMTEWKTRFNYTWDWQPRLVQTGIWDAITLQVCDSVQLDDLCCRTTYDATTKTGGLVCTGAVAGAIDAVRRISLTLREAEGRQIVARGDATVAAFQDGVCLDGLCVDAWWPNGLGEQPLYELEVTLCGVDGSTLDASSLRIGFKQIAWQPCEGAAEDADPWVCTVNGIPVFLQGFNWTPIRPNFADLTQDDYRRYLTLYRDLGCNLLRVWGGAVLEKTWFYDLCDELGLMVWQEFPLSSSGTENWPPEDARAIDELEEIAASYIARRQHHASLLLWCGGNELQGALDGNPVGIGKPVTLAHPLMRRWADLVQRLDPGRRFLVSSASGPRFMADSKDFGKGLHWDVHGPWNCEHGLAAWEAYWRGDDALLRSEVGCPGTSSPELIEKYAGGLPLLPGTVENPLWRRTAWWIQWPEFLREEGRAPLDLEEFCAWSQIRQSAALAIAAQTCKRRFPRCGGIILWMGHDAFPCTANTAVIDFEGALKPAAEELGRIFRGEIR